MFKRYRMQAGTRRAKVIRHSGLRFGTNLAPKTASMPRIRILTAILAALAVLGPAPRPAAGQLISPGKLSAPHADLEGIRSCTSCHQLREKGVDASLCLDCHGPLRARIEAGAGYHSTADAADECARCHKEHFGRDFQLTRWEPSGFDHTDVGWKPEGAHGALACRDCHTRALIRSAEVRVFKARYGALDRTYMGLDTDCRSCHRGDDPHERQFDGRTCDSCHGQEEWEGALWFDHDETRYPLEGRHVDVECTACHSASMSGVRRASGGGSTAPSSAGSGGLRYADIAFGRCSDCHRDEHQGTMGAGCSDCHVVSGWESVREEVVRDRFDHDAVFVLEGAHAEAECGACHAPSPPRTERLELRYRPGTEGRAYPRPVSDDCQACHSDEHSGEFGDTPTGSACEACHSQTDWYPADYDFRRHNEEARFRLEGAHLATPCLACHPDRSAPAPESVSALTTRPVSAGERRFRIGTPGCADCHLPTDPHAGQFDGRACDSCHLSNTFAVADFDHDGTRYPLDGAHSDLACGACHEADTAPDGRRMVRYRPLGTECTDCHGGEV